MEELRFPRVTNLFGPNLSLSDFEHIQKLGKGTFGFVSLYKHIETNEYYAIKRIQLEKQSKKSPPREQLEMLTRKELQILYKIDNRHIIKLLDHFQDHEAVYLITQFIQGLNLYDQTLKTNNHLPFETIAEIIFQLCQGLEQLHNNHIIHRDIKLQNVMFNHDLVKIVDLGCSNFYADSIKRQTTIGTRLYWSPQVIAQEQQNDRLDVWCMGVVLYQLIYLDQPFSGNDIERKIRKCEYSFPSDKRPQPQLEDLFKKIFTNKMNRISARAVKYHPWIRKYRKQSENLLHKFQQMFSEEETSQYRQLLREGVASNNKFLQGLNSRSDRIENWLKEARRQLKKK